MNHLCYEYFPLGPNIAFEPVTVKLNKNQLKEMDQKLEAFNIDYLKRTTDDDVRYIFRGCA